MNYVHGVQNNIDSWSKTFEESDALYSALMNLYDEVVDDTDNSLIKYVLDNIVVENSGIIVQALREESVIHNLPNIFWLANIILHSLRKNSLIAR